MWTTWPGVLSDPVDPLRVGRSMYDRVGRDKGSRTKTTQGAAVPVASMSESATRPGTLPASGSGPVPSARRLRQPSWRDVRLLVGVALVLVSTVAGALVVQAADRTTPMYAAARALTPGESLDPGAVTVVGARVAGSTSRYLAAEAGLRPGLVVLRPVLPGELVPVSAVGDRSQVTLRPVTVPVAPEVADGLTTGMLVDVWVAQHRPEPETGFVEPERLAVDVAVGQRATRHGALGSSSTTAVQVLVAPEVVPKLIHAVDDAAMVTLVPVPSTGAGLDS